MDKMSPEQIKKFLSEKHLMNLTTVTPEGYPHVTPVWFEWDGTHFFANTTPERRKTRNIRADNKVGFSIAPEELPYAAVVGYGEAELSDDPEGKFLRRLAARYLPPDVVEKYFRVLMEAGPRITIRIDPKWMTNWQG